MCQLTLINVPNKYNRILLHNQLVINSKISHKDGAGFYQPKAKLFKTKTAASEYEELADIIKKTIKTTNPILAHVRLTTYKTTVSDDNSHPFETTKLVLAHNGTLTLKDIARKAGYGDVIDTQMFLAELDKAYTGTNIVEALNTAMSFFTGPFAFLIYSKVEDKYFVVRGETKKLHISKIKVDGMHGFVINTEADDLVSSLSSTSKQLKLVDIKLTYSTPELIQEKTVNVVDIEKNCITKIGDISENKVVTTTTTTTYVTPKGVVHTDAKVMDTVYKLLTISDMQLTDLDVIITYLYGYGIAYMAEEDWEEFATYYVPALQKFITEEKRNAMDMLYITSKEIDMVSILNANKLQFPYFLNRLKAIKPIPAPTQLLLPDKLPKITEV